MKSVLLFWFLAASLAAQTASLEGTVVDKTTGQPVSSAHVRLLSASAMAGQSIDRVYGALSDRAGHYSIADIQPGLYFVAVDHSGFIGTFNGRSRPAAISLKPGDHLADHKLELTPAAHLSGRVVDENGDPMQSVSVQIRPASAAAGNWAVAVSDDRGEFRGTLGPGGYYLLAQPMQRFDSGGEIRNQRGIEPYKPTYYPSTTATADATIVEVKPGEDVSGLEIRLSRGSSVSQQLFSISGQVTGIPEGSAAVVLLSSGDSPSAVNSSQLRPVNPDGTFLFGGLESKYYRVNAQVLFDKVHLQSPSLEFHLTADQPGAQLNLQPPEEVLGKLEITGGTGPAMGKKPSVFLDLANPFGTSDSVSGEVSADGTFRIPGVLTAKYKLRVEPLPENAYIKTVALDGAAVGTDAVDLSHGVKGAQLAIRIALDGAQISGKLLDRDGKPLANPLAMLFVWNDVKQAAPESHQISTGEYQLKAVHPGQIHIVAVDALEGFGFDVESQDQLYKTLLAASEEIELKPGDRLVKDLKVAAKEKLDAGGKQ